MSLRLSAHMTIMQNAAQRAAKRLLRDFAEVEQLQVSVKGPGDFVSQADIRAEQTLRANVGDLQEVQLRQRVLDTLALVGMGHAALKRPHEISGGMKQRVGIARALAMEPKVLLLDEPFGALDALTRAHLQDELLKIVERMQCTVVMVTHDVDEAVLLSDRIVMLTNGPAATIGDIVPVTLPRPRDRVALAEDADYMHCRKAVLDFLYTRHSRPAVAA